PCGPRAGEDPRRADAPPVSGIAYERRVAVGRQRDRAAEEVGAFASAEFELRLLAPRRAAAREDPRGARFAGVARAADERRIAIVGECDAAADVAFAAYVAGNQLFALGDERRSGAGRSPAARRDSEGRTRRASEERDRKRRGAAQQPARKDG